MRDAAERGEHERVAPRTRAADDFGSFRIRPQAFLMLLPPYPNLSDERRAKTPLGTRSSLVSPDTRTTPMRQPRSHAKGRKRKLEPPLAVEHGDICPGQAVGSGSRIAVYWPGEKRWYAGIVASVERGPNGNEHTVDYDDGTTGPEDLDVEKWRWEGPPRERSKASGRKAAASSPPVSALKVGQRVVARFPRKWGWFSGSVRHANADGTLAIDYDDGTAQDGVLRKDVDPFTPKARPPPLATTWSGRKRTAMARYEPDPGAQYKKLKADSPEATHGLNDFQPLEPAPERQAQEREKCGSPRSVTVNVLGDLEDDGVEEEGAEAEAAVPAGGGNEAAEEEGREEIVEKGLGEAQTEAGAGAEAEAGAEAAPDPARVAALHAQLTAQLAAQIADLKSQMADLNAQIDAAYAEGDFELVNELNLKTGANLVQLYRDGAMLAKAKAAEARRVAEAEEAADEAASARVWGAVKYTIAGRWDVFEPVRAQGEG